MSAVAPPEEFASAESPNCASPDWILDRPRGDADFARRSEQRPVLARDQRQFPVRSERAHLGHDVEQAALGAAQLRFRIEVENLHARKRACAARASASPPAQELALANFLWKSSARVL